MNRENSVYLGKTVALAAAYVIAAKVAFLVAFVHTSISPIWLPSGLAVAAAVKWGYRAVPGVALGAFAFNAQTAVPLWVAAVIGIGNSLEAAAAIWLLRRARFAAAVGRVRDVVALACLGALTATIVSATIGVTALWASGVVTARAVPPSWVLWWSGDAVGVLTLTPLLLWAGTRRLRWPRVGKSRLVEAAVLACALAAAASVVVTVRAARPVMAFPVVVWAALRYRQAGAILASLCCSVVVVYASAHGFGPYAESDRVVSLLTTQVFVGVLVATSLLLAATTAERETAVTALRGEREQVRAILGSASDPFVTVDRRGLITAWNASAEELFGWGADEAIGRALAQTIVPPWLRADCDFGRQRAVDSPEPVTSTHLEVTGVCRDGRSVPLELAVWQVPSDAGHFHAFLRDVSEPRRLALALEAARDEALEASRLKSRFLATMSHEIRTPLNAVIGLSASLRSDESGLSDRHRRGIDGIHSAARALRAIIDDILDFSKLEAGRVVVDEIDFDLDEVIGEAVGMVAGEAAAKSLTVTADRQPGIPSAVRGDPVRLRQILLNLLSNAVKFTARGDIAVRVQLDGAAADGTVPIRIEVADTGIGIPAAAQARIFDAFVQGDASTTRSHGGTGLGLAIARRLAEAMGGTLQVHSMPGQGSTFSCVIPLRVPAARLAPGTANAGTPAGPRPGSAGAAPRQDPAGPHGAARSHGAAGSHGAASSHGAAGSPGPASQADPAAGALILLAEDNQLNQLVAIEVLTMLGYRAEIATDGQRAVEMARTGEYQAILMDCQMPVMDGYTATRVIRQREAAAADGRRIPIIATTASVLASDRARCLAAGMDDFVAKPIDVEALAATLARWIGWQPRNAAPAAAGAARQG